MAQDIDKILEEIKSKRKSTENKSTKIDIIPVKHETVNIESTKISENGIDALSRFMNEDTPKTAEKPIQSKVETNTDDYTETVSKKSDDYIDDKFVQFFTESVIVTKSPEATSNVDLKRKKIGLFKRKYITDSLSLNVNIAQAEESAKNATVAQTTGEIRREAAKTVSEIMSKKQTDTPTTKETVTKNSEYSVKTEPKIKENPKDTKKHIKETVKSKANTKIDADSLVQEILAQKKSKAVVENKTKENTIKPVAPENNGDIISQIYTSVIDNNVDDNTGYISLETEDNTEGTQEITQATTDNINTDSVDDITNVIDSEPSDITGYIATGEFAKHTEGEDVNIIEELFDFKRTLTLRVYIGIICGIGLMLYNIMGNNGWGLPSVISPIENSMLYYLVATAIYLIAFIIFLPTIISGFKAKSDAPRADTFVSLSAVLSLAQLICGVIFTKQAIIESMTIFGAYTCFALAFNAMGKIISTETIIKNMKLANVPDGINAGYIIKDEETIRNFSRSLEESLPSILVSRKTRSISNFIDSGFSVHANEYKARGVALLSYIITFICLVLGAIRTKSIIGGIISRAGAAALQIPLAHTLVSSVPSALMQKSLERVGALINGWRGIDQLSKTTHVSFDAKHIFPEGTIVLHGIKMFEKERIDLAILYRASVLIKECEVLRPVFLEVIAGRTNILPEVQSCEYIDCQGYVAWVNNVRVILGNRNLMMNYDIELPSLKPEETYLQQDKKPMYLAVGGRIFGMFVFSYSANDLVAENLEKLVQKGVSVILTSNDFNIDSHLVEKVYGINSDYINVLNQKEAQTMRKFTEYSAESEASMAHLDSLPSLVAGFYRAESTKNSENICNIIQLITVLLCAIRAIVFTYNVTLPTLSIISIALTGFAFMGITMLTAFIKRYQ